jgi:alanyl-tRNA synthetase
VGDEVLPGNKDQMYFVRRLIRRAVRFARNLNINTNFTRNIVESFIDTYKLEYKVLSDNKDFIINEIEKEETKFRATLEKGIKEFEKIISKLNNDTESSMISGEDAFNLLQSFGFPIELTEELAKEKNIKVDMQGFNNLKSEHADASRTASAGKFKGGLGGDGEMEIKYHTATHMLHQALKIVLGESVQQKGSNITNERLRFDFAFERKMTDDEKKQVEDIVNQNINANLSMTREEMSYDEARSRGAIGLFDDKYGDKVSVYSMGNDTNGKKRGDDGLFSIEFCGGPHVSSTGNMGHFKIAKEEAVSAGVRRIKAVLD